MILIISIILLLTGCSSNDKSKTQSTSNQSNVATPSASVEVTPQSPGVYKNTEPDKIVIYNKGRSTAYEKGTEAYKALKDYIYKMISEKAENNQLKLGIVNGDVSELKKELTVEFLYTQPVEFRYPNGSKEMITKFLIAAVSNLNSYTIITAPATPPDKGLYAGGVYQGSLFMIRANPSNDELILKYAQLQEEDLRQVIWDKLSQESKAEIVGTWKDAKMEKVIGNKRFSNLTDEGYDGKELIHIVFSTKKDHLLGPIGVYINPETKEVVGGDYRE